VKEGVRGRYSGCHGHVTRNARRTPRAPNSR
jgi:hypothetical protein